MAKITVSQTYNLHFKESYTSFGSSFVISLKVPLSNHLTADVKVDPTDNKVHIYIDDFDVSEQFCNSAPTQKDLVDLPTRVQEEVREIQSELSLAQRKVLSLVKYHMRFPSLSATVSADRAEWSYNGNKHRLPGNWILEIYAPTKRKLINEVTERELQASLDADIEPLLAMQYLHRAMNSGEPNYKWIDATMAAELAVKEVLVRKHPSVKTILEELPSPPLTKLYGPIMREYLGEESPYRNIFVKGIEIRNKLVHRPSFHEIGKEQAYEYVRKIEAAILHLLVLLYPEDDLIASYYRLVKSRLGNPQIISISRLHTKQ